jgi:hypothetical protein
MKTICAWCRQPLRSEPGLDGLISHGICKRCMGYVLSDRKSIRKFLDSIDAPVLAVDGEGRAISANRTALLALNKGYEQVAGRLGGEVIECQHSYRPEGCGKTVHCTGCQIRGAVNHTRATGSPLSRAKAYQPIMTPTGVKSFDYYISTERLGDGTILVRIDEAVEAESAPALPEVPASEGS